MSAVDAAGAAAELKISRDLFLRTYREMEGRGFPRPLPLVSRGKRGRPPLRWSLDAIRDWIREPRIEAANTNTPMPSRMRAAERRDLIKLARLG